MQETKRSRTARPKTPSQLAAGYPLSIVVPAYNAAEHLRLSLPALLANDLAHTEVVVVDDQSEDATAQIVERLSGGQLRLVRQPARGGPAAARNRGIQETSHRFLLFLDADVVLPPHALLWIRESLDIYRHRPEVGGVLGTYSEKIRWEDFFSNYKNLYTCHLYRRTDTLSPFVHTAMLCIRREVLESVGGFDEELATVEDFRLGLELGSAGYRFVIDWRVAGEHLKRYDLAGILREDTRRIQDLRRLRLDRRQRAFSYRAHRWSRLLSVLLPVPTLLALLGGIWVPQLLLLAAALAMLFYLLNVRFLIYVRRVKGWAFALRSALFLWLEMLWAQGSLFLW